VTGGCASWRAVDTSPQEAFAGGRPEKVRVTTEDGVQTVLLQPRLLGNVLAGVPDDGCRETLGFEADRCSETGIALHEIQALEVQERGPIGQVALAAVALGVVWLLVNR
jgi:hypothetical protein